MGNDFPKVFIIILNYNGGKTVLRCLKSVFVSDYPNFELVMVDNNSSDGSFELAKNYFTKAHFIKNEENLGFAAGNNIGIRFALEKMADYIFLLNNDAVVFKNTLSELIKSAQRETSKKIGIFSPVIFKGNSKDIWFAGGKINWLKMRAEHIIKTTNYELRTVNYITGCAMLIKKNVFKKTGLLDENFFLYYEDADFCLRSKKNGFKSAVVTGAKANHQEKSEENKKNKTYWLVVSGIYFFRKNSPWFLRPYIYIYLWLRIMKNKIDLINGKNELAGDVARAYKDSRFI